MTELVVGADIGGTATRAAVSDLDGRILSIATGGSGNPNTVGLAGSAAQISAVIQQALAGRAGTVVAVVIGLAGGSRAAADPRFLRAAVPDQVGVVPALVSDLSVAFSAATPARLGYVIVAGTGAVAAEVVDAELVSQRDGWGWLLGDVGSGFWLGRAAVRATLRALQEAVPLTPLHRDVLATANATDYPSLLQVCYSSAPIRLAGFAPLVSRQAEADPDAHKIAEEAARALAGLVISLRPRNKQPIVLAGSVLTRPGPIRAAFLARISGQLDNPLLHSTAGVIGGLWIGLRPRVHDAASVHARLVSSAEQWNADSVTP
jgi:N-acetylglucosamine kinase-like BadF-type ATPase